MNIILILFAVAYGGTVCTERICKNCYQKVVIDGAKIKQCTRVLQKKRCCGFYFQEGGMFRVSSCDIEVKNIHISSSDLKLTEELSSGQLLRIINVQSYNIDDDVIEADECLKQAKLNSDLLLSIIIVGLGAACTLVGMLAFRRYRPLARPLPVQSTDTKMSQHGTTIVNTLAIGTQIPLLVSEK